jgi:hypothetical protein
MKKKIHLFILVLAGAVYPAFGGGKTENPSVFSRNADHRVSNSIDEGGKYLKGWDDLTPVIMTYVTGDGSVSVCSATSAATFVYEYSKDMEYLKTMRFENEFPKFGAFVKDNDGNYYFFYAKDVGESERNVENMALVKYDNSGNLLKRYKLNAYADNSFNGIKEPFGAGSCRMDISGSMICVYFARKKFKSDDGLNHQSSYGFILDKDSFARVDVGQVSNAGVALRGMKMPYVSHSFNQFILPVDDGFAFVDQGDAFPRGFHFSRFQNEKNTKGLSAFKFKRGGTYQYTFAQLGGLAKTPDGYIFAGTYEKNSDVSGVHNDSRNFFILTFDDALSACGEPVWITDYDDKEKYNAANPKITALDAGRYLLMWERTGSEGYEAAYTAVIDENGKLVTPIKKINTVRLNINDTLRYSKITGNVYWAVNQKGGSIAVYAFNPDKPIKVKPPKEEAGRKELRDVVDFTGSFGIYLNGWNENLFSAGLPLQLGVEFTVANMGLAILGEGGAGIGSSSFRENLLVEWNYGGAAEFYFPRKKIGLGFGYGIVNSALLSNYGGDESDPELFNTTYMRFGLIFRGSSKKMLYAQRYGDGNWGFGLQWTK